MSAMGDPNGIATLAWPCLIAEILAISAPQH
jgi:hypothetical protein